MDSLVDLSRALQQTWESLTERDWEVMVDEPEDNPDLGPLGLGRLPLLRLTEVEVHGSDLDLGLGGLERVLRARGPSVPVWTGSISGGPAGCPADRIDGSWLLVATDGPVHLVTVRGESVSSVPAAADAAATAVIEGTSRDILSLLLGRPTVEPLAITGDQAFGRTFTMALPGP